MIKKESFSIERIKEFRKNPDLNKSDPAIIEKMLRALSLLEHLVVTKLDFVFKGGTCLILLLDKPNRFSIDIDIITPVKRNELEGKLNAVIENSDFIFYKLDEKRSYKKGVPKTHYKFYWSEEAKDYILLDVLINENKYPNIIESKIDTQWLVTEKPYHTVKTPTKEAILGDKLTAFAPNTTGVPYGKSKETDIVKQLFDVSILINEITDIEQVYNSFIAIATQEMSFREHVNNPNQILDDIFETALLISKREKNKTEPDKLKFQELQKGIRSFNNFLIKDKFRIEHVIEASAKVAYFAMKLKNKDFSEFSPYNNNINLKDWKNFLPDYEHLSKLRKSNKPAYYYWYKLAGHTEHK